MNYELSALLGMGVLTFIIRVVPFLHAVPKFILKRLETRHALFPPMFLTLLVLYCLSPVRTAPPAEGGALAACALLVAALQWIRGNTLLSLFVGTAVYVFINNR